METRLTPAEFKQIRHALHFSQQHMADKLNVQRATLSHWEMGKDPIPYRVRSELIKIVEDQADRLDDLADWLDQLGV